MGTYFRNVCWLLFQRLHYSGDIRVKMYICIILGPPVQRRHTVTELGDALPPVPGRAADRAGRPAKFTVAAARCTGRPAAATRAGVTRYPRPRWGPSSDAPVTAAVRLPAWPATCSPTARREFGSSAGQASGRHRRYMKRSPTVHVSRRPRAER